MSVVTAAEQTFRLPANIAFGLMAAVMIVAAIRVVSSKNVVHAALWLVVVLSVMGANYLLLQAEFVAVTQVMVYIGAIVVLFLFATMLTHNKMGRSDELDNPKMRAPAVAAAVLLVAVLAFALLRTYGDDRIEFSTRSAGTLAAQVDSTPAVKGDPGPADRTQVVSDAVFGDYLLPFELVSVLLLGALVGAIVLARKE